MCSEWLSQHNFSGEEMTNREAEIKDFTNLAKQYGYAARVLTAEIHRRYTAPAVDRPPVEHDAYSYLWVPSLHLSAHALECILKACAHLHEVDPPSWGKEGHDLNKMMSHPYADQLRIRIAQVAQDAAETLRSDSTYDNLDFSDPAGWIEDALRVLGRLHFEAGSKLRYGSDDPDERAPSSPLLTDTIYLVTQELGHSRHLYMSPKTED